jgi:septal ring factor EnvC (AmiA/AmiB activator)
MAGLTT